MADGKLHVVPLGDLVGHDPEDECACIPTPDPVSFGAVMIHHSLDGREHGGHFAELREASGDCICGKCVAGRGDTGP